MLMTYCICRCAEEYLQTGSCRLNRKQLRNSLRNPRALHEQFWVSGFASSSFRRVKLCCDVCDILSVRLCTLRILFLLLIAWRIVNPRHRHRLRTCPSSSGLGVTSRPPPVTTLSTADRTRLECCLLEVSTNDSSLLCSRLIIHTPRVAAINLARTRVVFVCLLMVFKLFRTRVV